MCNNKIKYTDTLMVQLQAGQRTFQLPDDAIINKAVSIKQIIALYDANGQTGPNGETLVDATSFKSGYISFTDATNNTKVQYYPLQALALETTAGYPQPAPSFDLQNIVTTKCQIFFGDNSNITNSMYLMLSISYE